MPRSLAPVTIATFPAKRAGSPAGFGSLVGLEPCSSAFILVRTVESIVVQTDVAIIPDLRLERRETACSGCNACGAIRIASIQLTGALQTKPLPFCRGKVYNAGRSGSSRLLMSEF